MNIRETLSVAMILACGASIAPPDGRAAEVAVVIGPVPRLIVVIGTPVSYCETCDDDVFFYDGAWYSYRLGVWYMCRSWGAPWVLLERGRLPTVFLRVPPGRFRHRFGPYHPAHDHHPKLDHWKRDASRDRRDSRPRVESATPAPADAGDRDKASEKKKGKGDKKGGGRGHGRR